VIFHVSLLKEARIKSVAKYQKIGIFSIMMGDRGRRRN